LQLFNFTAFTLKGFNEVKIRLFSIFFFQSKGRGQAFTEKELETSENLEKKAKSKKLWIDFTGVNRNVALSTAVLERLRGPHMPKTGRW